MSGTAGRKARSMRPGRATLLTPWAPLSDDGSAAAESEIRALTDRESDGVLRDSIRGWQTPGGRGRGPRGPHRCGCRRILRQGEIPVAVHCADSTADRPQIVLLSGHLCIQDRPTVQVVTRIHDREGFFASAADIYRESTIDAVRAAWPGAAAALSDLDSDPRLVMTSKCIHNRCRALLGEAVRRAPGAGAEDVMRSIEASHRRHGGLGRGFHDGPAARAGMWSAASWLSYARILSAAVAWSSMESDPRFANAAEAGAFWLYTETATGRLIGPGATNPSRLAAAADECLGGRSAYDRMLETVSSGTVNGPVAACFAGAQAADGVCALMAPGTAARPFTVEQALRHWRDRDICDADVHHLFPLAYVKRTLGGGGTERPNALANSAITDKARNRIAQNRAPSDYWPEWASIAEDRIGADGVRRHMAHHCLAPGWHEQDYPGFVAGRSEAIAARLQSHWLRLRRSLDGTAAGARGVTPQRMVPQ